MIALAILILVCFAMTALSSLAATVDEDLGLMAAGMTAFMGCILSIALAICVLARG
jgi:hypothetical protein